MSMATLPYNANKDTEVPSPPNDGISWMAWSSKALHLAAASWDNQVRVWDVQMQSLTTLRVNPVAAASGEAPLLTCCWSGDGRTVFFGGCDGKVRAWPVGQQASVIGQHQAPVKSMFFADEIQSLCTGSWDKSLKYWDGRTPTAQATVPLPERVYCMDVVYPLAVVCTADRSVLIYDMRKPTQHYKHFPSPLKHQSRCVAAFPDKTGFAVGSIEGRVAIHHVEDKDAARNFAFKCHREQNDIYAVNSIAFHPQHGTFATAGADGTFNFWDKENKQRLKPFAKCAQPVSAAAWSADGNLYAYAVSYDWSRGAEFAHSKNFIFIHPTPETEIKARGAATGRTVATGMCSPAIPHALLTLFPLLAGRR